MDTIVTLDLRGTKFKTLKSTFDKLNQKAIGSVEISPTEYFIDKDPKNFHLILDFARSGKRLTEELYLGSKSGLPLADYEREYFFKEAKEYGLCFCPYELMDIDLVMYSATNNSSYCSIHNKWTE